MWYNEGTITNVAPATLPTSGGVAQKELASMQPQHTTSAPSSASPALHPCECGCGTLVKGRFVHNHHRVHYGPASPQLCLQCGNLFVATNGKHGRKYCSLACAYASPNRAPRGVKNHHGEHNPNFRGGGVVTECKHCGTPFQRKVPSDSKKYCSSECVAAAPREYPNGHPRGMLGKKHTTETLEKMAAASRGRVYTDEMRQKQIATKLERYGTGRGYVSGDNPYSRARRGRRWDLDNMYFRSSWEANYARYLNWRCVRKEIKDWKYEAKTFRFDGVTRGPYTYLPDFEVELLDGTLEYHEVKGWMDAASRSRLKRMKEFYPDVPLVVVAQAEYKLLNAQGPIFSMFWE